MPRRRRLAILVLLFLASIGVYMSTGHHVGSGDTVPSSLMSVTLALHGTTSMDYFAEAKRWEGKLPYYLKETPHGVISYYPVATGLIAAPLLAIPVWIKAAQTHLEPWGWIDVAMRLAEWAAAIIAALTAVLFLVLCWRLELGPALAFGLTLLFAFGSEAMCINSQALWQHGPATLFVVATVLAFVEMRRSPGIRRAVLLSLAAAIALAIRPMTVWAVGPFFLAALIRWPRRWPALLLPAVPILVAVAAYNLHFFGHLGGGYDELQTLLALENVPAALLGSQFSPARGLFFYYPVTAVAFALAALRPRILRDDVAWASLGAIVATILFYSMFRYWEAGWSVGPRYMTEVQPLILLLVGLGLPQLVGQPKRAVAWLCFGVLLPYSLVVQAIVTFDKGAMDWNPDRMAEGAPAIWDFIDNPVTHAWASRAPAPASVPQ